MRSKFGAFIVSGTGKIGGQAFSYSGGRSRLSEISRATKKVIRVNAAYQRSFFDAVTRWRLLTESQRSSFEAGIISMESAFDVFVSVNMARARAGLSVLNEMVPTTTRFTVSAFSISATVASQQITVTSTQSVQGLAASSLYLSRQQSPGTSRNARGYFCINYGTTMTGYTANYTTAYTARYGALKAGRKIFYKLITTDRSSGVVLYQTEGSFIVT